VSRTDLRVLTLNVLSPEHAGWARRRALLQAGIDALRPDVIALQEDTGDLLGPGYDVARHGNPSSDGVGAALYSRWPMLSRHEIDLRVTGRVDLPWSAVVLAEIEAPFGPLLVVHHKPTYHVGYAYEREQQAVACARHVEEFVAGRDMHVVLLGDFDDTPDSASIRFLTGKQSLDGFSVAYRDAWPAVHAYDDGHTFTPENPLVTAGEMALETGRRIDYVMVRCGIHGPSLDVADCRRVFDEPVDGVWPSDHFGVLADLAVPDHPPGAWI
jgi:endonuclease/exonuclease/phosphatase family metal-dependent hydrolase